MDLLIIFQIQIIVLNVLFQAIKLQQSTVSHYSKSS